MQWDDYEPFDPGVDRPLGELPKKEARAAFERLMAAKDERKQALVRLLAANGITLDDSDEAVQRLDDWFRGNVEGDPGQPGRLRPMWYAVVNDVSLYLGDLMIERSPTLRWVMYESGRKNVSYQRHVVIGFSKIANPKYAVDIDLVVATHGHRVVAGLPVDDDLFVRALRSAAEDA